MARALWKGAISFGLVTIPVSLYPAKDARENITFHLLHRDDLSRVHNKRVDEEGHEVALEDIVKGYEYEKDRYVVLEPADLKRPTSRPPRASTSCSSSTARHRHHLLRHALLHRTDQDGRRAYALLRETLQGARQGGRGQDRHPRAPAPMRGPGRRAGDARLHPALALPVARRRPIWTSQVKTWTPWQSPTRSSRWPSNWWRPWRANGSPSSTATPTATT